MQPITVHREMLYKEMWEEPTFSLAKRCISDVALAKVCRNLNVPVLPRGTERGFRRVQPLCQDRNKLGTRQLQLELKSQRHLDLSWTAGGLISDAESGGTVEEAVGCRI